MTAMTQSVYEDTIRLLDSLDENQLLAIHAVIAELSVKNAESESILGIKTEEQLWNHIDHSLSQAKSGMGRNADEVIKDLLQEYSV